MTNITAATALWDLRDVELISDGPSSRVYRAQRDGQSVIAKILKPAGFEEAAGMDFLRWRDGTGAIRLLAQQDQAYLLEDGGKHTLLRRFRDSGDDATLQQLTDVLAALHSGSGNAVPANLMPLEQQFEALFKPVHHQTLREQRDLIDWAARLARELLASQVDIRPLHGDMHHGNVVSEDGAQWKAIDPKGLIGDPAYDYANIFGNPIDERDAVLDKARCMRLARSFAEGAKGAGCYSDLDELKILRFAAANSVLSACWSLEEPQSAEDFRDGLQRLELAVILKELIAERRG
jgi:streptomycin 6-kinase